MWLACGVSCQICEVNDGASNVKYQLAEHRQGAEFTIRVFV